MSAGSQPLTAFQVPKVTEVDLHSFHQAHFGNAHVTGAASATYAEAEDVDDQLGYYPDGVKRTLTDEQIAMFRHSEIQTILKERRHRDENADTDDEMKESESPRQHNASFNEEATYVNSTHQEISPSRNADPPSKRKWTEFVETSEKNPDNFTHRRLARELDEVQTSSVDLLYGEEEASAPAPLNSNVRPRVPPNNRTKATHDQPDPSHNVEELSSKNKTIAAKFIWPKLGVVDT